MKNLVKAIGLSAVLMAGSCTDLEVTPESTAIADVVFTDPEAYDGFLARLYAGLAVSGQQGPAGDADIRGIDEGFSNYLRQYWKAQELTTDEAVIAWGDAGLPEYNTNTWTAANPFVTALYARILFQVSIVNEFLRETTTEKLNARGNDAQVQQQVATYRAEARFLRALAYMHGIDLYGDIPFYDETFAIGGANPTQGDRAEIFNFIESELKEIESLVLPVGTAPYGRADQGAVWMTLAKLYLNAAQYTSTDRWDDAAVYVNNILNSNAYSLTEEYEYNFLADNFRSNEIIFPVVYDGATTQSWGGMTFLVHAAVGGDMEATDYGVDGGWFGLRTTPELVDLFPDDTGDTDSRAMFFTQGQTKEIANLTTFTDGYAVTKFKNIDRAGFPGNNLTFVSTDFPLYRLADVHLMYAELAARGAAGTDLATATNYVNTIRERAYEGSPNAEITQGDLTLDFILEERARELYWEGHRRTDLIRFGKFTGSEYLWSWKGGQQEGTSILPTKAIFPIPADELSANPNLTQNEGYN
jgi:hypothetical protein